MSIELLLLGQSVEVGSSGELNHCWRRVCQVLLQSRFVHGGFYNIADLYEPEDDLHGRVAVDARAVSGIKCQARYCNATQRGNCLISRMTGGTREGRLGNEHLRGHQHNASMNLSRSIQEMDSLGMS